MTRRLDRSSGAVHTAGRVSAGELRERMWTGRETFSTPRTAVPAFRPVRDGSPCEGRTLTARGAQRVPGSRSPLAGTPVVGLHNPPPGRRVSGTLRFSFRAFISCPCYRTFDFCPQPDRSQSWPATGPGRVVRVSSRPRPLMYGGIQNKPTGEDRTRAGRELSLVERRRQKARGRCEPDGRRFPRPDGRGARRRRRGFTGRLTGVSVGLARAVRPTPFPRSPCGYSGTRPSCPSTRADGAAV